MKNRSEKKWTRKKNRNIWNEWMNWCRWVREWTNERLNEKENSVQYSIFDSRKFECIWTCLYVFKIIISQYFKCTSLDCLRVAHLTLSNAHFSSRKHAQNLYPKRKKKIGENSLSTCVYTVQCTCMNEPVIHQIQSPNLYFIFIFFIFSVCLFVCHNFFFFD